MRKYKFKVVDKNEGSCIVHSNSSFYRRYLKDTDVMAPIDSVGIMVFHTRERAENFKYMHSYHHDSPFRNRVKQWKIKRVLPIGRGKTPRFISKSARTEDIILLMIMLQEISDLKSWYDCWSNFNTPIEGTICYPGVHIID